MKLNIIHETFDRDTGLTTVTIQNKYGHFTGTAKCHPEDEYSMFQGERIAIIRANIKFLKFQISQTKAKRKSLIDLINAMYWDDYCTEEDFFNPWYDRACTIIRRYNNDIKKYQTTIDSLKENIIELDKTRQDILSRTKKEK